MEETILLCSADPSFKEFGGQVLAKLPTPDALAKILPDIFLLDMDLLGDAPITYLADIADRFPSIQILIIADSKYPEEVLFPSLAFGCQGWIFKENLEKMKEALQTQRESRIFLKPYVSQRILQEFKKFSKGEFLLAMEEEILRQNARGVSPSEIEKNLNLNEKSLRNQWESIRQKLVINSRAEASLASPVLESSKEKASSAPEVHPITTESFQVVTFYLGKEEFAIGLTDLQEIERVMSITPLPNVAASILGVINLRGKIVPVVDLRVKLGIPTTPLTKESRIMIINTGGTLAGLVVDSVKEVLKVSDNQVKPPPLLPLNVNEDFISGIMNLESRLVLLLDLKKTMAVK